MNFISTSCDINFNIVVMAVAVYCQAVTRFQNACKSLKSRLNNESTSQWQSLQFGYWNTGLSAGNGWKFLCLTVVKAVFRGLPRS